MGEMHVSSDREAGRECMLGKGGADKDAFFSSCLKQCPHPYSGLLAPNKADLQCRFISAAFCFCCQPGMV